ncbi:hypothetical protein Tco_0417276 [Tanacetum coccineum]
MSNLLSLKKNLLIAVLLDLTLLLLVLKLLMKVSLSKNYVRKFLRALHPKWRAKVMAIEELKDLSSLALAELIGNLKVHELFMEKVPEIYNGKKEMVKSITLIAKKESSDDEISTFRSDDEEYAIIVRNFKKCGGNHLIGDCPKPPRNKDQKAFVGGCWSDNENEAEDKTNDKNCLMAQSTNYVSLDSSYYSDNASAFDDNSDGSTIKAYGSTIHASVDPLTSQKVAERVFSPPLSSRSDFVITRKKLIHNKIVESKKLSLKPSLKSGLGYVKNESSTPPTKLSPLVDDDVCEEEAIENNIKVVYTNNIEDEFVEVDEVVNIKESKNHPLEQVIGNLNQRTLRSQVQNQSNFFCFISTIEPKNVNEALGDESWVVAM